MPRGSPSRIVTVPEKLSMPLIWSRATERTRWRYPGPDDTSDSPHQPSRCSRASLRMTTASVIDSAAEDGLQRGRARIRPISVYTLP